MADDWTPEKIAGARRRLRAGYLLNARDSHDLLDAVTSRAAEIARLRTQSGDTDTPRKNPAAVALGTLGGAKGGNARATSLSEGRRKEIARRAANARWSRKKK